MKVSKRDFLKLLGAGASVASLTATPTSQQKFLDVPTDKQVLSISQVNERLFPPDRMPYLDAVDNILYDRVRFPRGSYMPEHISMFTTPAYRPCPYTGAVKGPDQTNMQGAGQIYPPNNFWVQRIHIAVNEDIAPADYAIVKQYAWKQWLMEKRYANGPMFLDATRQSWRDVLKRKAKPVRSAMEFPHGKGLLIPYGMYFRGEFSCKPIPSEDEHEEAKGHLLSLDGNGVDLFMGFEGIEFRGIQ